MAWPLGGLLSSRSGGLPLPIARVIQIAQERQLERQKWLARVRPSQAKLWVGKMGSEE